MLNISEAEKFVLDKKINNITTSQIRKFLAPVNKIYNMVQISDEANLKEEVLEEIKYMKVQFAYLVGKNQGGKGYNEMKELYNYLEKEIKIIKTKNEFINFARYVEAIVAYHKFYEKGDNNNV